MNYTPVIGLEVHAELRTLTKMFCGCLVVDSTRANPNTDVCPVCLGLPGVLPLVNRMAVELGLRAALALDCLPLPYSIFARKNYFYPDLPKGYQISQYETPLAANGHLSIKLDPGEKVVRIRRVHLEEDTGKLTHIKKDSGAYTLVDLNRAGVPLLEIVSEPDLSDAREARIYAETLQQLLRYIDVSSCDMEKGAIRFEANVSVMPVGSNELGTRTEIKNLNSFRSLEKAVEYEIQRQIDILHNGGKVIQETVGWNENEEITFSQRNKEEAHDYRYFPEPDLPPIVVSETWLTEIKAAMPELPGQKTARFSRQYQLSDYDISILTANTRIADFFEHLIKLGVRPKDGANWVNGQLLGEMNERSLNPDQIPVTAADLAELIKRVDDGNLNLQTAKSIFSEMVETGKTSDVIIREKGLKQISDPTMINNIIQSVLAENPVEVKAYLDGKETLAQWFFGQVMAKTRGQASPAIVKQDLETHLQTLKANKSSD